MKKILQLLFLLPLAFCFVACGDDDNEPNRAQTDIIGVWQLVSYTNSEGTIDEIPSEEAMILSFTKMGEIFRNTSEAKGTYVIDKSQILITWNLPTGTYTDKMIIIELTQSKLVINGGEEIFYFSRIQ